MSTSSPSDFTELLNSVNWNLLSHAYGPARDAPDHLMALLNGDQNEKAGAVNYLYGAIAHQGSLFLATAPVALAVASILLDPRLAPPVDHWTDFVDGRGTLRSHLLNFLATVVEGCRFDTPRSELQAKAHPIGRDADVVAVALSFASGTLEPDGWSDEVIAEAYDARSVLACRDACPRLADPVFRCLDDPSWQVRVHAGHCATRLIRHPELADRQTGLASRLEQMAIRGTGRERAAMVLSLGELGAAPRRFLTDPEPAVRACAALAPALATEPGATREILTALADPVQADAWLPLIPQLDGRLRFLLVKEAIARVASFEELVAAAIAVANVTSHYAVERDWGPLLAAAFPVPVGRPPDFTPAQRSFLAALVTNEALWDRRFGNPRPWFQKVGLPYDRDGCRRLLDS
ncbi:MAG: hypothetical protein M3082_08500 [Candidatus Dormibacteraeota bacterium]|nr:hypothetical protein [Candidatus Dormibacteraeota bacterium]